MEIMNMSHIPQQGFVVLIVRESPSFRETEVLGSKKQFMSENSTFFSVKFTEESALTNEKHSLLATSDKTRGGGTTWEVVACFPACILRRSPAKLMLGEGSWLIVLQGCDRTVGRQNQLEESQLWLLGNHELGSDHLAEISAIVFRLTIGLKATRPSKRSQTTTL